MVVVVADKDIARGVDNFVARYAMCSACLFCVFFMALLLCQDLFYFFLIAIFFCFFIGQRGICTATATTTVCSVGAGRSAFVLISFLGYNFSRGG